MITREQVARALFGALTAEPWERQPPSVQERYLEMADAVLPLLHAEYQRGRDDATRAGRREE